MLVCVSILMYVTNGFWFVFVSQEILQAAEKLLEGLDGITSIHARYYDLSSSYHKLMGNHAEYYREALRYLGCTDLKEKSGFDALRFLRMLCHKVRPIHYL